MFLKMSGKSDLWREINGSKDLLLKYQRRYWRAEDYYWTTEKPLEGSSQVVLEN